MKNENTPDDSNIIRLPSAAERKEWERKRLKPANDVHHPKKRGEPIIKLPIATKSLSALMVCSFVALQFLDEAMRNEWIYKWGFVPARYMGTLPVSIETIVSPITFLFLHGSWLHLGVNTLSLMAFGAGLEKALGARKLLVYFFVTGLVSLLAQFAIAMDAQTPLIGASGAISGIFGGLLLRLQEQGYIRAGWKGLFPIVALWLGMNVFFGMFGVPGNTMEIAWVVHAAGFTCGLLLYGPLRRNKSLRH